MLSLEIVIAIRCQMSKTSMIIINFSGVAKYIEEATVHSGLNEMLEEGQVLSSCISNLKFQIRRKSS